MIAIKSVQGFCATIVVISMAATASPAVASEAGMKVLGAAARIMGKLDPHRVFVAQGTVQTEGRTGKWLQIVDLESGRFLDRKTFALFVEANGFNGHLRWVQDRSGAHHILNAPFTRAETISEAWLRKRRYLDRSDVQILDVEHETIAGHPTTVVTVEPKGGNPLRLAFDNSSHLLVRSERDRPLSIISETYSDYRKVGGALIPFHTEVREIGGDGSKSTILLRSVNLATRGPASRFAPPAPPKDVMISGSATIPLDGQGYAIIPARLNGHEYDFILDTGGHDIITPAVAAELGLKTEGNGSSGGAGAGTVTQSDTQVAKLEFGGATLTNQHFYVIDMGNGVKRKDKPALAGILGLELLERLTITLDEPQKQITIAPRTLAPRCNGNVVPLMFDEDMPVVRGTIDNVPGLISIDTGNAASPIVLWKWALAHRTADRFRNGKSGSGSGMGGVSNFWLTPHHEIRIGTTALHDLTVNYAEDKAGYFSSRTDAMNLGHDLLQRYAVTFDYARSRMCLVPRSTAAAIKQ